MKKPKPRLAGKIANAARNLGTDAARQINNFGKVLSAIELCVLCYYADSQRLEKINSGDESERKLLLECGVPKEELRDLPKQICDQKNSNLKSLNLILKNALDKKDPARILEIAEAIRFWSEKGIEYDGDKIRNHAIALKSLGISLPIQQYALRMLNPSEYAAGKVDGWSNLRAKLKAFGVDIQDSRNVRQSRK